MENDKNQKEKLEEFEKFLDELKAKYDLISKGQELDLEKEFERPKFQDWFSLDAVSFWEASILSFGFCPNAVFRFHPHKHHFVSWQGLSESSVSRKFLTDFQIRTKSAIAFSDSNPKEFKTEFCIRDENNILYNMISLDEFRNWTIDRNLKIDDDFRNFQKSDYERKIGGISLNLPYRNSFIEALAEITWRFYGNPEIAKSIQQKYIKDELKDVYGWDVRYSAGLLGKIRQDPQNETVKIKNWTPLDKLPTK